MPLEVVVVDVFGTQKVQITPDENWRDEFNEYQAGYAAATNKLEFNLLWLRTHMKFNPMEKTLWTY